MSRATEVGGFQVLQVGVAIKGARDHVPHLFDKKKRSSQAQKGRAIYG